MQITQYELGIAFISILISGVVWTVLWRYISLGKKIQDKMWEDNSQISEGFGVWYAKNIVDIKRLILISLMHSISIPIVSFSIVALFIPFYFQQIIPSLWAIILFFALLGLTSGLDRRYSEREELE